MGQDLLAGFLGTWSAELNLGSVLLRVLLSMLLSAIVGCERSSKRHSAGLRTFMLVSLVGTGTMLVDQYILHRLGGSLPLLSAAAILGAATISGNSILFSSKNQIKGLTTSVGLWCCGVVVLACMSAFPVLEKHLKNRSNHFEVHLELKSKGDLADFVATIRALGIRIDDIESNPAYLGSGLSVFSVSFTVTSPELKKYKKHGEIIEALRSLEYVYFVEEMN